MIILELGASAVLGLEAVGCLGLAFVAGVTASASNGQTPGAAACLALGLVGILLAAMAWAVWP